MTEDIIWPEINCFDNYMRILQWNIRGMLPNHNSLDMIRCRYKPDIICLQEARVHYYFSNDNEWIHSVPQLDGYHPPIADPLFKTIIYVKKNLQHLEICLPLTGSNNGNEKTYKKVDFINGDCDNPVNIGYGSHVAIKTNYHQYHKNFNETIIISNIYRSPSTSFSATHLLTQESRLKQALRKYKWNNNNIKHIILGDINATHVGWGLPGNSTKKGPSIEQGKIWMDAISTTDYDICNDGKPTRFEIRNDAYRYSWIDIILAKDIDPRRIKSNTIEMNLGSDHHCIITDINTRILYHKELNTRQTWHIPESTDWKKYQHDLAEAWTDFDEQSIPSFDDKQQEADFILSSVFGIYTTAILKDFRLKRYKGSWKPWITAETQAICIEYHKWERFMRNSRSMNFAQPEEDLNNLYRKLSDITTTYQRIKKNRCHTKHAIELKKLNASITRMEIKRALSTFDNHRASGPDNMDIRFLKKASETTTDILEWAFNRFYTDLHCIPSKMKDRFICYVLFCFYICFVS